MGQVLRLAVLNGYYIGILVNSYGKDDVVMYHAYTDKDGVKHMSNPVAMPTDVQQYSDVYILTAYRSIARTMGKDIDDYLEVNGDLTLIGDKLVKDGMDRKMKQAHKMGDYEFVHQAESIRTNIFLSNPAAPKGSFSKEFVNVVDDQVLQDLADLEDELNRIAQKQPGD